MSLQQDIRAFISPSGSITLNPSPIYDEDNCHLFNWSYILLCRLHGERDFEFEHTYLKFIEACNEYKDAKPGLYRRAPYNYWRLISHDENIAISAFSVNHASHIVDYGKSNFWSYDNRVPGVFTFRGWQRRFLSPIAFYKAAAGYRLGLVDRILFTVDTLFTALNLHRSASNNCLTFLMCFEMAEQKSFMVKAAVKLFRAKCTAEYGDLSGLWMYFNQPSQPAHPLCHYAKGVSFDGKFTAPKN